MMLPASDTASTATAVAFMVAVGESFNVMSALNSSPWSAENFTGDDQMVESLMRYVKWTAAVNLSMGVVGSSLARSPWPLAGTVAVTILAWWLYARAAQMGLERNTAESAA